MSIQDILKLPESERRQVAELIWDSLETKNTEITSAQIEEVNRRVALDKAGKMPWYSIEDVKEKLSSKFK